MKTCIDCNTPVKGLYKRCEEHRRIRVNFLSQQRNINGAALRAMRKYMSNYDELDVKANRESLEKVKAMKKTRFTLRDIQSCPAEKLPRFMAKLGW